MTQDDDDADAAFSHLKAEGGSFVDISPRAIVRGRYKGDGGVLHFRRRCQDGTFLHIDLTQGEEHVVHAVLEMTYPYNLTKGVERADAYDDIWRETRIDRKSKCRTWMGFGYTAGSNTDYVDCAEHVFPCSVGYGYHSAQCAKNVSGEWNWCSGDSTCGKKVWMFELSVFETREGRLEREKLAVQLTYILFNKEGEGRQRVAIMVSVDGVFKGWLDTRRQDKETTELGHYDKGLLKKSAEQFVRSKRHQIRKPHPPHTPAYLRQVYQAPVHSTVVPRIQKDNEETEAMLRCLLQLFNGCEAFNMPLLIQVLYDQVGTEATRWDFIDEMHTLINRQEEAWTMTNALSHLSDLPPEKMPYDNLESYPPLMKLLLRLLVSLKHAVAWGKWELEIRSFVRKLFEIQTTWVPVEGCRVCTFKPVTGMTQWHFPDFLLQNQQDGEDGLMDIMAALKRRIDNPREIRECGNYLRCR